MPALVTYSFFTYRKKEIKREVKLQLANLHFNSLSLLKFSQLDVDLKLRWEHSKEFEYDGKMYDIIKSKKNKDSVFYWCWVDKEETNLNTKLKNVLSSVYKSDVPLKKNSHLLVHFFKLYYFFNYFNYSFQLDNFLKIQTIPNYKKIYKFLFFYDNFQPPELV